ncbi:MAG: hypothetical protein GC168_13850 [Candidatus Hydrogenedens sp.]|nr:hypothetical protein [Candidatus Hydrogenedens sp.]
MQDLVRRHRVIFGWVVFLFIGVPMVLWTVPQLGGKSDLSDRTVIEVGDVPVLESELRRNLQAVASQQAPAGERKTFAEMDEDGTASKVLEQMVSAALLRGEREAMNIQFSEDFLVEQLRKDSMFQTEDGKFDYEAWNDWVEMNQTRGMDWKEVYASLSESLAQRVFLELIQAPGNRVDDSELDYQLRDDYTKMKIRYLQIMPPINPDEQEVRDYYDAHAEEYREKDKKVGEFVVLPLAAPVPEEAASIIAEARGGADFAELANKHSKLATSDGGDMGWRRATESEPGFRKPLFDLAVGEVSDPIPASNGYFIYKVEEDRMVAADAPPSDETIAETPNPEPGEMVREVHARQIFLESVLTDEQRTAIQDKAMEIANRAKELGGLEAAAQEAGLEVKTTEPFTDLSPDIGGVPTGDVFEFRKAFSDEELEAFNVIPARENVYVAVLKERVPGELPGYDAVRERVVEDVTQQTERSDLFRSLIKDYTDKIKAGATTIAQIQEQYPELTEAPQETDFFTRKDFLFQQQFYVQPRQIFEEIGHEPIGTMAGPFEDFRGEQYFVELLDRQDPTDEDKAKWPEEKETLRNQLAMRSRMDVLEDYALHLNQTKLPNIRMTYNNEALNEILGRNDRATAVVDAPEAPAAEAAAPTDAAPAADTSAPEPGDGLPQE